MKVLIGLLQESPLSVPVSAKAMRDVLGLAEVTGDIVLATPATRVQDLSGLVVEKKRQGMPHRAPRLVACAGHKPFRVGSRWTGGHVLGSSILPRHLHQDEVPVERVRRVCKPVWLLRLQVHVAA